jgi:hypothetical protein
MVTVRQARAEDADAIGSVQAAAGWSHDGGRKVEAFQGADVAEIRYRKPL